MEIIQSGEDIISDGLSWVGIQFFVGGGVGQMFLNLTDIKGDVHEAYSTTFVKWFDD